MDVKCERCNTEYEFDDALVSGRGTTVKCTNCGHKFKIRRGDGDFSEDFWNVTTADGRTLVFTSLRELQRAIQGYLVERNDLLSRGGLPQKAIGQIPELAPFFDQREAAKKSSKDRAVKTQDGLGPAAQAAIAHAYGERSTPLPGSPTHVRQATRPEFPAPPPSDLPVGKTTLIGTGPRSEEEAFPGDTAVTPPMRGRTESTPPLVEAAGPGRTPSKPPTTPRTLPPPVPKRETRPIQRPASTPPMPASAPTAAVISNTTPIPERTPRTPEAELGRSSGGASPVSARPATPPTSAIEVSSPLPPRVQRSLLSEIEEERDRVRGPSSSMSGEPPPPRRRPVGGFIVTAVVMSCLLMLAAVWAQKHLGATLGTKPTEPAPTVDPRVAGFLTTGEKALADGNLELAKESFDKASALAEKDPHVLFALARLAAVRADVPWLKSRLLPPDAADDHRITRDSLAELSAAARKAADDALLVAPDDPAALRAKIDALRISGDRDGARALVGKITPSGAQPESAYVLAALDLAEVEPLWSTVIERLKVASSAETGPGRARAALVYALARSGDGPGAKAEVERLTAMAKPHPLLPLLRSFANRAKLATKLDAGAGDTSPAVATEVPDAGKTQRGSGGGGLSSDPRELVSQGERARAKGDYDRARTLFSAALEKNPNDSEALAGLAAIAYAQRDLSGARASYKRVLAMNPNYMPALVGLADVEWDSGDKATATKMYKDIVDRYPEGAYPGRVKQRSEGGG